MKPKIIFAYFFLITLLWINFYFNKFEWLIKIIIYIFIYFLIFYLFHIVWSKIKKIPSKSIKEYINIFLYKISVLITLLSIIIWSFTYYNNEISPAKMPEYTISNWEKIVRFQAMSHIWTSDFYETVKNNLISSKKDWFVYFYEWVKPWTKENLEKFNKAIWIKFDPDLYKNFSKLYWIANQDQNTFIWLENNLDFNVDLNMDQIIEEYEKNPQKEEATKLPIDANKEILSALSELNEKELKILVYVNQSILNFIIKSDGLKDAITNNFWNKELFYVILHKRNEVLAKWIIESKYNKIYTTYWLLHFEWVLKLLQENDKRWKIINYNALYPIQ